MKPIKRLPSLAEFLKTSRERASLTQKDVAVHFGYTTSQFVSEWERGLRTPPGRTLRKLVDLYDLPLNLFYDILMEEQTNALKLQLRKDLFG